MSRTHHDALSTRNAGPWFVSQATTRIPGQGARTSRTTRLRLALQGWARQGRARVPVSARREPTESFKGTQGG